MRFNVAIPARYASTRLPGKVLRPIAGRPMLQHVHDRAVASGAARVVIATDDERIRRAAESFGATVCMTSAQHPSGSDRLAEMIETLEWADDEIVVNLQGDEPLMPPTLIRQVAEDLDGHPEADIATAASPIRSAEELFNPHVTKVVMDARGYALYFSRAPIPWERDVFTDSQQRLSPHVPHLRHIGLYAYRAVYLKRYARLPPCELEQAEALEQLRALWNGTHIHVCLACETPGPGVDTQDDLARVEQALAQGGFPGALTT